MLDDLCNGETLPRLSELKWMKWKWCSGGLGMTA
jgi:hypothetical protein